VKILLFSLSLFLCRITLYFQHTIYYLQQLQHHIIILLGNKTNWYQATIQPTNREHITSASQYYYWRPLVEWRNWEKKTQPLWRPRKLFFLNYALVTMMLDSWISHIIDLDYYYNTTPCGPPHFKYGLVWLALHPDSLLVGGSLKHALNIYMNICGSSIILTVRIPTLLLLLPAVDACDCPSPPPCGYLLDLFVSKGLPPQWACYTNAFSCAVILLTSWIHVLFIIRVSYLWPLVINTTTTIWWILLLVHSVWMYAIIVMPLYIVLMVDWWMDGIY
jgi:hypothetical protein